MSKKPSTSSPSGGISFAGMLQILFIGLKLTGHINWSWWWVMSPMWIGILIVVMAVMFAVVVALLD